MIDVFVIGAGPAGLSAAINAKVTGKSVEIVGNPKNYLSKAPKIDNYLGLYAVNGKDMMQAFVEHARKLEIEIKKEMVLKILPMKDRFMINIGLDVVEARTIILALGVLNQKKIDGEDELLGRGVSYCATCDGMLYRGKEAVVWGLSEEAVNEANQLNDIGVNVTFVSNKDRNTTLNDNITHIKSKVKRIESYDSRLKATLEDNTIIETDALFILRSTIAPDNLIDNLTLDNGYIKVDRNMSTNIRGVFAAGDCTGKPLQISKAVGEGLVAAQVAVHYIDKMNKER